MSNAIVADAFALSRAKVREVVDKSKGDCAHFKVECLHPAPEIEEGALCDHSNGYADRHRNQNFG